MVSSYPYPPQFIFWMREVFHNPQPFIDSCISEAQQNGYTGFNIDWEPAYGGNNEDALLYAEFLDTLSTQLHQHNIKVLFKFGLLLNVNFLILLSLGFCGFCNLESNLESYCTKCNIC